MLTDIELIRFSLESNLYCSKEMMEHAMFIKSFLTPEDSKYTSIFDKEINMYKEILNDLLDFSDGKISQDFIDSKQLLTDYTKSIEEKTIQYFNIGLDPSISKKIENLKSGDVEPTKENIEDVNTLNNRMYKYLQITLENLKHLNTDIKNGSIFLYIYPLGVDHLIKETEFFKNKLERLKEKVNNDPTYVYNSNYFHSCFMKEHSLFIRGLINPTNEECIKKANIFIDHYNSILNLFNNDVSPYTIKKISEECLKITYSFKDFNESLTEEVIKDKFYFIVLPLFIDHILRESYNFMAYLKYYEKQK